MTTSRSAAVLVHGLKESARKMALPSLFAAFFITVGGSGADARTSEEGRPYSSASSRRVVLVHGLTDNSRKMARLARYLEAQGWQTYSCDLKPSSGRAGMEVLARQLQAFVGEQIPAGESFDLVGFSMGGLVGRYYLQRLDGLARVRRFVTIATPHRGSVLAYTYWSPGFRQMRPGSEFLRDLDRDVERLAPTGFTSLWTPLDLIVLPSSSSVVPGARCRKVWCIAHPFMVWQRHCHRAVAESL